MNSASSVNPCLRFAFWAYLTPLRRKSFDKPDGILIARTFCEYDQQAVISDHACEGNQYFGVFKVAAFRQFLLPPRRRCLIQIAQIKECDLNVSERRKRVGL